MTYSWILIIAMYSPAGDFMGKNTVGFNNQKEGFKVLMPKESKLAKRIGYTVTTGVTHGLRQKNEIRDIKYWTYHHDKDHYAIVLISNKSTNDFDNFFIEVLDVF